MEIKCAHIYQLTSLREITTQGGLCFPSSINYSGTSIDSFRNGVGSPIAGFVQLSALVGVLECTFM